MFASLSLCGIFCRRSDTVINKKQRFLVPDDTEDDDKKGEGNDKKQETSDGTQICQTTKEMKDHSNTSGDDDRHIYFYDGESEVPKDITTVTVKNSVTRLGDRAFMDCNALKSITIPESVTALDSWVFRGCTALESITISKKVTTIGRGVFRGCTALRSIIITETLTTIGCYAFMNCRSLKSVTIPETVTSIGNGVFTGCVALEFVRIPNNVTALANEIFRDCTALKSVTIPESVVTLGDEVFKGCTALQSISIPETVTALGKAVIVNCTSLKHVKILATVTALENNMFMGCRSLEVVTLPKTITVLNSYMFYGCKDLTSITISPSVTTLGDWVFCGCESLKSILIPSVTKLGDCVFVGCKSLANITMPQSFKSRGNCVFVGCLSLPNYNTYLLEASRINDGPGPAMKFQGKTQKKWGPEWCGISLEQVQEMKKHPNYNRTDSDGNLNYLMRDFVKDIIEPATRGTGVGYALLTNKEKPLKAKVMVSHAWEESIRSFVEALENSKEEGPFWVCGFAIYQNNDPNEGVTISDQLGSDPEYGPFATVLRCVDIMLAVLTHNCDIYTRLWCVYEIFFAAKIGVDVELASHISPVDLEFGTIDKDICVSEAHNRVNSVEARCGAPGTSITDDERAIRETINAGFKFVDKAVERIRLIHLVCYPMNCIARQQATARDSLKDAIEHIIPCFAPRSHLKTFDEFLNDRLLAHPGFRRTPRDKQHYSSDHDYYITNAPNGNDKYDVFEEWTSSIFNILNLDTLSNRRTVSARF